MVYAGANYRAALDEFCAYKDLSIQGYGRAANEDVCLFKDEQPIREYVAPNREEL